MDNNNGEDGAAEVGRQVKHRSKVLHQDTIESNISNLNGTNNLLCLNLCTINTLLQIYSEEV